MTDDEELQKTNKESKTTENIEQKTKTSRARHFWDLLMANLPQDKMEYKEGQNFDDYLKDRFTVQRTYFKKKARQYRRLYIYFKL
ncbi:MAG TPA: hypothetical protein VIP70_07255 [Nitrososphaeraceae archaeon]|jgi:hypothetical protein